MSKKSFFKGFGKKVSLKETDKEPRALEEIRKEYDQTAHTAGQLQYLVYAKNIELEEVNKKLLLINQEFHQRQELDKKAKSEAPAVVPAAPAPEATAEVVNEQSK